MPKTLLLADDSVVIQKLVGLSFANEDVEIITVDNGDEAISSTLEARPDLVLADVVMPGKSGYEVCEAIKRNPELSGTPVLLLTGTFEAFDEERANQVGANGHITKPFEAQALVDRVNEMLSQSSQASASAPAAAQASNEFFDENLGDLAGSSPDLATPLDAPGVAQPPPATRDQTDDFAFGGGGSAQSDAASDSALANDLDFASGSSDSGLDDLLDNSSGDHTVAFMPPSEEPPPIPATPDSFAAAPPAYDDFSTGPMDDDLLPDSNDADPGATILADDALLGSADSDPLAAMPSTGMDRAPAAEPLSMSGTDPLESSDLSFGSQPTSPPSSMPNPDETVLAGDLFGDDPMPATPDANSISSSLPPSNGLDLDFAAVTPATAMPEAVVPENANDFDVSSSDLRIDPMNPSLPQIPQPEPAAERPVAPMIERAPEIPAAPLLAQEPIAAAMPLDPAPNRDDFSEPSADPDEARTSGSGLDLEADVAPAAPIGRGPDLTPMMRDRIHDTLEKVAWEAFSDLSESIVKQVLERVEQVAWEVIPEMAETLVREEIRRMKGEDE